MWKNHSRRKGRTIPSGSSRVLGQFKPGSMSVLRRGLEVHYAIPLWHAAGMSLTVRLYSQTQCFSKIASLDVYLVTVPYLVHHCLAHRSMQNESQNESEHTPALCSKHRVMPAPNPSHPCAMYYSLCLTVGPSRTCPWFWKESGQGIVRHLSPLTKSGKSHVLISSSSLWPCHPSPVPAAQRDSETDASVRVEWAWLAGNEWEFDYAALQSRANTIKRPAGRTWRKEVASLSLSPC